MNKRITNALRPHNKDSGEVVLGGEAQTEKVLQPVAKMLRHLVQKWLYLLLWFANCKFVTEEHLAPLSPFQCCPSKFCMSYCIASNIGKGRRGERLRAIAW